MELARSHHTVSALMVVMVHGVVMTQHSNFGTATIPAEHFLAYMQTETIAIVAVVVVEQQFGGALKMPIVAVVFVVWQKMLFGKQVEKRLFYDRNIKGLKLRDFVSINLMRLMPQKLTYPFFVDFNRRSLTRFKATHSNYS